MKDHLDRAAKPGSTGQPADELLLVQVIHDFTIDQVTKLRPIRQVVNDKDVLAKFEETGHIDTPHRTAHLALFLDHVHNPTRRSDPRVQEVINRIKPGDEAEIALDTYPGRTLAATVQLVDRDIPQGQVVASGRLIETARVPHGFVFVDLKLENDEGLTLAAGEAGAATVYTDRGQAWIPVRKVFFRWYTWLNYIITEMDIRGIRQP